MKQIFILTVMAALSVGAEDRGGTAPEFVWVDAPSLNWHTHGKVRIDGGMLTCEADVTNRNAFARADSHFGKPYPALEGEKALVVQFAEAFGECIV